jgi:hypothetical protein
MFWNLLSSCNRSLISLLWKQASEDSFKYPYCAEKSSWLFLWTELVLLFSNKINVWEVHSFAKSWLRSGPEKCRPCCCKLFSACALALRCRNFNPTKCVVEYEKTRQWPTICVFLISCFFLFEHVNRYNSSQLPHSWKRLTVNIWLILHASVYLVGYVYVVWHSSNGKLGHQSLHKSQNWLQKYGTLIYISVTPK